MKTSLRALAFVLCLLALPGWSLGGVPLPAVTESVGTADSPLALAVVRIPSHGCSGTVIETGDGWSIVLSCSHAFQGQDARKTLQMDGPAQPKARPGRAPAKLLRVDYQRDLSLIRIENGPFYCVPVAPAGFQAHQYLLSAGYDEMKWPITQRVATLLRDQGGIYWTREIPWHGRSGGALFDESGPYLVGVVQGYTVERSSQGMYVDLAQIRAFLAGGTGSLPAPPRAYPQNYRPPTRPPVFAPACPT